MDAIGDAAAEKIHLVKGVRAAEPDPLTGMECNIDGGAIFIIKFFYV